MILSIDTETYEKREDGYYPKLDSQEFKIGVITNIKKKSEFFYDCDKMADRLIEMINKENKRGGKTYIYGFNMSYDFYAVFKNRLKKSLIIKEGEEQIKYYSFNPFVQMFGHYEGERFITKAYFIDLMNFYPNMNLSDVGNIIGLPKMNMPNKVNDIDSLRDYLKRDSEIVIDGLKTMKKIIKELGYTPRKFLTLGNLSMKCYMNHCRKNKIKLFGMKGEIFKTENTNKIRKAFRGGRIECLKTGIWNNISKIDCNSMYPYIMANMDFPNLKSEKEIIGERAGRLIDYIGVVKCKIKCPKNIKFGYLPIRISKYTLYPKEGILEGMWTTLEIKKAIKLGYELIECNYGIFWTKAKENPLKKYMLDMWEERKKANGIKRHTIKKLMNSLYGKFSQERANEEIISVKRRDAKEWEEKGYKFLRTDGINYIMQKKGEKKMPKYANPIISIWITANARDYIYDEMNKINEEDLIYVSTDALIINNLWKYKKLKIGEELGEFKIEDEGECIMVGEGRYKFNDKIILNGIPRKQRKESILKGEETVNVKKQISLKKALRYPQYKNKIGQFEDKEILITRNNKLNLKIPYNITEK